MKSTDRLLSNISAIKTLLEHFPDNLLDGWEGKVYTNALDFIIDILRCTGINDKVIIEYLIGKIYGFEGQPGYSINGLYELLKSDKLTVDPQNPFVSGMEVSIKILLMALFTSIFTCSALPVLPNKVFDADYLSTPQGQLMSGSIRDITKEGVNSYGQNNDELYKLKFPINVIDIMDMMSISPVTSYGSLYYTTGGKDVFYQRKKKELKRQVPDQLVIHPGENYLASAYTYDQNVFLYLSHLGTKQINGETYQNFSFGISQPIDTDLEIGISIILPGQTEPSSARFFLLSGMTTSEEVEFVANPSEGDKKATFCDITINDARGGGEVNVNGKRSWLYLLRGDNTSGFGYWESMGGIISENIVFGESRMDDIYFHNEIATEEMVMDIIREETYYKEVYEVYEGRPKDYVRCTEIPQMVTSESPEFIAVYGGEDPNMLYRTYDMNAFIWYVINRGKKSNQEEKNHLMWDSRVSAQKNMVVRGGAEEWNDWYGTKANEGDEFNYYGETDGAIYPIIQLEKYGGMNELLVRIPSQRYFLPKKREELLNGTYEESIWRKYFNSSIYKFDWEYLQGIQILNPRLLLVRFIEHLFGLTIDTMASTSMNLVRTEIKYKLSAAIKSIISADDMESEDCYKVFSNEDFDNLLNEMLLQRYSATQYNGEVHNARTVDVDEMAAMLDSINTNATTVGNITKVTRMVNDVMIDPGIEPSIEYDFEFKFDSNLLNKLIWAIVMPIVESLFTPQVMLLVMINFDIMGVVKFDEALNNNFGAICNLMMNKILGFIKSIVKFVKDKIISILIDLFNEKIRPLLTNYMLIVWLEHITDWLVILLEAVKCLPLFMFNGKGQIGYIEDVDYADIYKDEETPENDNECQ
jgi:hypothetical protein